MKSSKYDLTLVVMGQRNWHRLDFCVTWHKPVLSGGTFRADSCQICHMELLGSDYRGVPGCLPDLGITHALQDFLQTWNMYLEETDTSREKVKFAVWEVQMVPNIFERYCGS